jgi:hypothetical protein
MRSELVFGAMAHVKNRYLLARLTSKTTRIFHRRHTRLEETANDVLRLFSFTDPQDESHPPSTAGSNTRGLDQESTGNEMRRTGTQIVARMSPELPPTVASNL